MIATDATAKRAWTEADLKGLPEDGYNQEVVGGELVMSPKNLANNTRREMDERLQDFFESGTQLAWIIDPEKRRVEVCQSPTRRAFLGSGGVLEGADLLPGFRYPVAELFKEWAWE